MSKKRPESSSKFAVRYHLVDLGAGFLEHIVAQARLHPGKNFLAVESKLENIARAFELDPSFASKPPRNLQVRSEDALKLLAKLSKAGVKTRHISIRMPDDLESEMRNLLPACRPLLARNGKITMTTITENLEDRYPIFARASGLEYRYLGKLEHPETYTEKVWRKWNPSKPIYLHEFVRRRKYSPKNELGGKK